MRDEVLIKRQWVAMVTWILANKRVREKCLLGDGKEKGNQRERKRREGRQGRQTRAKNTRSQAKATRPNASMMFFSLCIQKEKRKKERLR